MELEYNGPLYFCDNCRQILRGESFCEDCQLEADEIGWVKTNVR